MVATYAWLSGGEIPSQRLRSYTFGLAASIGFLGAVRPPCPALARFWLSDSWKWLATFTAPYFINPEALNWGPKYGYIWAPSCFVAAIWVYLFLPELKNRSLEDVSEMVLPSPHPGLDSALADLVQHSLRCVSRLASSESTSALARGMQHTTSTNRRLRRLSMSSRMRRLQPKQPSTSNRRVVC